MSQDSQRQSMQANLPLTSLIICSRNRPQLLQESVESVLDGNEVPTEILIMDQSDAPHPVLSTLQNARGCELRYIRLNVIGQCHAKNAGTALAKHDILVFTDDDVLVTPAWFGTIVRALLAAGPRSAVTGQVRATRPRSPGGFAPVVKVDEKPAVYSGRVGEDILLPMNMAIYRSSIDEVGGFDERLGPGTIFKGAEDNDVGFRLLESGHRILYVPDAAVSHRAWRGEGQYLPLRWSYGYAQGAFYAKHLSLRDRYILKRMIHDIGWRLHRLPGRIRWGELRMGLGDMIYVLGVFSGTARWVGTQRSKK